MQVGQILAAGTGQIRPAGRPALQILGPLRLQGAAGEVRVGGARPRGLLAALALHADEVVSADRLIHIAWGDFPPRTVRQNLHTYLWSLRRSLAAAGDGTLTIEARPPGYLLHAAPGELDWHSFRELCAAATDCLSSDPAAAGRLLRQALDLWRGPALADVADGLPLLAARLAAMDEERLTALDRRIQADLAAGRHAEMTGELAELVAAYPFREQFRAHQMVTLYRCGRQAEALEEFRRFREELASELGVDPSPKLYRLYEGMLRADPGLDCPGPAAQAPASDLPVAPVPRQLPPLASGFTGRRGELRQLDELLEFHRESMSIGVVSGVAGVGKTALALAWAHAVQHRFPDGTFFADLHGYGPAGPPAQPGEVLDSFLGALGIRPGSIPADLAARAGLLRTMLSGKRALIVLDNAASAEQVRPLLPGSPGCMTVVTSRTRLPGLMAREGARRVALDPLAEPEALDVLRKVACQRSVDAEIGAAADVARLCDGLPLALRIAADRAVACPSLRWSGIARQLGDERARLHVLTTDDGDTAVRVAFSCSYRALPAETSQMFRLLGLHAGPEFGLPAASALADLTEAHARRLLDALTSVHLLEGCGPGRYRFHDLLRLYAAERARKEETESARAGAVRRMLTWYLHGASSASRTLDPERRQVLLGPPDSGRQPPAFASYSDALAWCDIEQANLAAAARVAADTSEDAIAWKLPIALWSYYILRKSRREWIVACQAGLGCARRIGDRSGEAQLLVSLGICHGDLREFDQATSYLQQAFDIACEMGDPRGKCSALFNLGPGYCSQGRYDLAVDCYQRATVIARKNGDRWSEGITLSNLGFAYKEMRRPREALKCFEQALALCEQTDNPYLKGRSLHGLGGIRYDLGDFGGALNSYQQALSVRRGIGDRPGEAASLHRIGNLQSASGDPVGARRAWQEALAIYEDLGDPHAGDVRSRLELFRLGSVRDPPGIRLLTSDVNGGRRSRNVLRGQPVAPCGGERADRDRDQARQRVDPPLPRTRVRQRLQPLPRISGQVLTFGTGLDHPRTHARQCHSGHATPHSCRPQRPT